MYILLVIALVILICRVVSSITTGSYRVLRPKTTYKVSRKYFLIVLTIDIIAICGAYYAI